MTEHDIDKIFKIFFRFNAQPTTELHFKNAYTLLIAVILSARTTDKIVNRATDYLFTLIEGPEDILNLDERLLIDNLKIIGLWRNKLSNIIKTSQIIVERFNSVVPDNFEDLITLPGVGGKTASVFLNTIYHVPLIAVDTHVFRVSNRIGLAKASTIRETEKQLHINIPLKWRYNAHHWLILHGRYICKARTPKCNECIIAKLCEYNRKLNNVV